MTEPSTGHAAAELRTTGVLGLDQVLAGGVPGNCLYLVQGDPGSGDRMMKRADEE